jgi:multidrug efflux pump subunit AcrA (membrane-fusion protein)
MKKNLKNNLTADYPTLKRGATTTLLFFAFFLIVVVSCSNDHAANDHDTYTCPMHPTVTSDKPGTCPVCGMDLVLQSRPGEDLEISEDLAKLMKSPNETVVGSMRTIQGQYKAVAVVIESQGVATYDTRKIYSIPSRVGGRLEKLYLKYAYQPVRRGQKVADIYSPELVTAQRELLFLLENDAQDNTIINAAKIKLGLLGMSKSQIQSLIEKKETTNTFSVFSPYAGYVIVDEAEPFSAGSQPLNSAQTGDMNEMGPSTSNSPNTPPAESASGRLVREGDYVSAGQTLFTIVNDESLRIDLNIPSNRAGSLKKGDRVELDFGNGQQEETSIDFVQPFFNEGQDFLKVRVYPKKSDGLRIGQLVSAKIVLSPSESLWIPKQSVVDLGIDKIVFVKVDGALKPKKITTGISSAGLIQVIHGLSSSEEIAENAQYLVDSESFIKTVE